MKLLLGVIGLVTVVIVLACSVLLLQNRSTEETGGEILNMAQMRVVENAVCIGDCENVTLTSDQEPGRVFIANEVNELCVPVVLWANRVREGQIGINGYAFYQGGQANLRPVTVEDSWIDGRGISVQFLRDISVPDEVETFIVHLKDIGDWNLLDAARVESENGSGFQISTQYDSGNVTMFDGCSESAKDLATYALYQSPNLVGPGDDQTYLVSVVRRGLYGASVDDEDVTIFSREYASSELTDDILHVDVVDDDITFSFDLVRE